ncbi:shikimate kinase [Treponema pedis]|uniref:shikimate kinase n=1 Tax=Treponema pedis TaxID=409322 RepID=UPI00042520FB|nr:shikimate kinase [Treponema pedis]
MLFIVGMSRAGKTETGKTLAKKCGAFFFDTDAELEKKYGLKISGIYNNLGEKKFRIAEFDILKEISIHCADKSSVICTGGGIAENSDAVKFLKNSKRTVLLDTDIEIIFERIKKEVSSGKGYPKFLGKNPTEEKAKNILYSIYNKRIKIYKNISEFIFKSSDSLLSSVFLLNSFI